MIHRSFPHSDKRLFRRFITLTRTSILTLLCGSLLLATACSSTSGSSSMPTLPTASVASGYRLLPLSSESEATATISAPTIESPVIELVANPDPSSAVIDTLCGDADLTAQERAAITAQVSHILNNVVPKEAADVERFAAVFQYFCETTNFAPDMGGSIFAGTDSVLLKGSGLCYDFSTLLTTLLPELNIPCVTISNRVHAWNQVVIDGETYHTDLSWGVGSFNAPENSFRTFLMNDAARQASFSSSAAAGDGAVVGDFETSTVTPPPATSDAYAVYEEILFVYATDIEGGRIFYGDDEGIQCMSLDGTTKKTVTADQAAAMVYRYGVLYYLRYDDGSLCAVLPGGEPSLIDNSAYYRVLMPTATGLLFGNTIDNVKSLFVLPTAADFEASSGEKIDAGQAVAEADRSYFFTVRFEEAIDVTSDLSSLVVLTDSDGRPLATRMTWSNDGKVLTVRPLYTWDAGATYCLYIVSGIPSAEKGATAATVTYTVTTAEGYSAEKN